MLVAFIITVSSRVYSLLFYSAQAINLDPSYSKAYYRRATCYLQVMKPQLSIPDFKKVLQFEPKNELIRTQMVTTQKMIRKIEFEKAIEREAEQSALGRCREIIAGEDSCIPTMPQERN